MIKTDQEIENITEKVNKKYEEPEKNRISVSIYQNGLEEIWKEITNFTQYAEEIQKNQKN